MEQQNIKELTLTRVLNAPQELVFKAWTDPEMLAGGWGPRGVTAPVCEIDLRPGGALRICMHAPQLGFPEHWMDGIFNEVVVPERLVFTSTAFKDESGNAPFEVLTTVTFEAQGQKTKLTMNAVVTRATPEMAPAIAGMDMGWNQSLDKLTEQLAGIIA
jgi:uncharacterized protein YndB with AHSA1/START domain